MKTPNSDESGMLIGAVARQASVSKDTVRFYERQGLLKASERQAGTRTYKEFAPATVERLLLIKQAQESGFTLREIKNILAAWGDDTDAVPPHEIARLLQAKLQQTEEKLRNLEAIRAYLAAKLEQLQQSESKALNSQPLSEL